MSNCPFYSTTQVLFQKHKQSVRFVFNTWQTHWDCVEHLGGTWVCKQSPFSQVTMVQETDLQVVNFGEIEEWASSDAVGILGVPGCLEKSQERLWRRQSSNRGIQVTFQQLYIHLPLLVSKRKKQRFKSEDWVYFPQDSIHVTPCNHQHLNHCRPDHWRWTLSRHDHHHSRHIRPLFVYL